MASARGRGKGTGLCIVAESQDRAGPIAISDRDQGGVVGLALDEPVEVRECLLGLIGAKEIINRVPELERSLRLLGE